MKQTIKDMTYDFKINDLESIKRLIGVLEFKKIKYEIINLNFIGLIRVKVLGDA